MTNQEMNDFLISIGGLKNGYYTDREPIIKTLTVCPSSQSSSFAYPI